MTAGNAARDEDIDGSGTAGFWNGNSKRRNWLSSGRRKAADMRFQGTKKQRYRHRLRANLDLGRLVDLANAVNATKLAAGGARYQAGADPAIDVTGDSGMLTTGSFIWS